MRYLVTGGAGFIGSQLVDFLLNAGGSVTVLDDYSTGVRANLEHLEEHVSLRVVEGSILDSVLVENLCEQADCVFHLAASVGVQRIVDQPLESLRTNLYGTEIVLEAALKNKVKVILASSSEVYGKNSNIPLSETADRILGPTSATRWSYSEAKALDEMMALSLSRSHGLQVSIARLFNTVGPRQVGHYGMVIPRLVSQALQDQPMTVFGTGEQSRCFCHVTDVVEALVTLVDTPGVEGEVFNIGSEEEISILDLAELIRGQLDSQSPISTVPYGDAYGVGFEEVPRRKPDTSKLRSVTGWRPTRSTETIIRDVARNIVITEKL